MEVGTDQGSFILHIYFCLLWQKDSANEDPMTVFSSMDANRFTPITVIDLDGETSGHLHHNGNRVRHAGRHTGVRRC